MRGGSPPPQVRSQTSVSALVFIPVFVFLLVFEGVRKLWY